MKVLLTGASGQLAQEFQKYFKEKNIDFGAPRESELDITDKKKVNQIISSFKPTHIINCAAYNLVDDAEDKPQKAFSINRDAVETLAQESDKAKAVFVHFGTDYVFDGTKNNFYSETDKANPLNIYAKSKYEGELKAKSAQKYLILRPSWVIGSGNQNFLYKLKQWASKSDILKVSADEVSIPTFTFDIVNVCVKALENGLTGLYHLTSSGYASRYELARRYFETKGYKNIIVPVPAESFQSKAKRPLFTPLSNSLISSTLNIAIPDWEISLDKYCKEYDN